jgi:membrane-bound serine protease (ClpP class)
VDAAERIADALQDAGVPTYAYINRRAFSAGALISLATDGIYMRPGSVIGAATPVVGDEKAPEKIVSAMRSEMRALAEARGLDPAVAEAMVDEEIAIEGRRGGGEAPHPHRRTRRWDWDTRPRSRICPGCSRSWGCPGAPR